VCSDPRRSSGPDGRGNTGPYQFSPRLDDEPSGKSGAGENQDRQDERPDQDDVLTGNDRPPVSRPYVRQLLRRDLYAAQSFSRFYADHDIDVRADLSGARLEGANFFKAALDGADLAGVLSQRAPNNVSNLAYAG
jgi:hypothetical protein